MDEVLPIDEFQRVRKSSKRLTWLFHDVNIESGSGLEIGALNNPTPLPSSLRVKYVDYAPTEILQQYPHLSEAERRNVVPVSYVWSGSGSLAEICRRDDYDFIIACQVIEHVPNILGWIRGLFDVLKPGGVLNLAIPDRRFTFDVARKESSLGEIVEAYLLDYKRPSLRQIFDHTYGALDVKIAEPWDKEFNAANKENMCGPNSLQFAFDQCKRSLANNIYYDSHCWIFTPLSFIQCVEGLMRLKLFPFFVSDISSTESGGWEFYVSLQKKGELSESERRDQIKGLESLKLRLEEERHAAKILSSC